MLGPIPARRLCVITCMDARIEPLAVLGFGLGDATVLRNGGGRVTDDVLRSLAVAVHKLEVEKVALMQHTECGVLGVTDEGLRALTGADLNFFPIDDHEAALRADIELLAAKPYLERITEIEGLLYDTATGQVHNLVRWQRS
jgi:carbonic anhydrase